MSKGGPLAEFLDQGVVVRSKNARGREYWAKQINEAWQSTIEGIFQTGLRLETAKAEIAYGEWGKMVEDDLPFSRQYAHKLMAISSSNNFADVNDRLQLPAHPDVLYPLAKLNEDTFEAAVNDGRIHPKMQRKDALALLPPKPKRASAPKAPSNSSPPPSTEGADHPNDIFSPLDRCIIDFRLKILMIAQEQPQTEWSALFAALDNVVADIKSVLNEQRGERE